MLFFIVCFYLITIVNSNEYGYLNQCPGSTRPVVITRGGIDVGCFVVLEVHEPATANSPGYLHRRRFTYSRAARGIGTDGAVDFRRRKTMFFLDGYMDSTLLPTGRFMIGNMAAAGYNVIGLDAIKLYSFVFPKTARLASQVGNYTAQLIRDLTQYGLKASDVELIGVSLGGQVASLAAKHFHQLTGEKVSRIYAMDPGGPCFTSLPSDRHLRPDDADFVQVVHTDVSGYGMAEAMGHVDFYINGGQWQFFLDPYQPIVEELFSHVISVVYFYSSAIVYPDKFVGIKCKDVQQARQHRCYENDEPFETNVMGFKVNKTKPGVYYIPVRGEAPFYPEDGWMKKKIVYPLIYNDAMSDVDNFVLEHKADDFLGGSVKNLFGFRSSK